MDTVKTRSDTFVKKESFTKEELEETIDKILDRDFRVYDRLAEI